ncbi:MAG: type I-U CRISPR-associated helicase/endonuclease Cas3 [Planctomycetaceae bacterium]
MSDYPELKAASFADFFHSIYGYAPFHWQSRLAEQVCDSEWPRFIKLPTSSGKTSCLDIAVFALAIQAYRQHTTGQTIDAPRRIFFVVDRRIIVNEAFLRASRLAAKLTEALDDPSSRGYAVARWLQHLTGNDHAPPLDCYELRGGIYRDDAWVRSLLQPTIITSTVDQVGSRLLFRGYGVSDRNLPIHAALTANDSLIILDEAHCSNPFSQTLNAIARYRDVGLADGEAARWSEQPIWTPFRLIEMTATPRVENAAEVFQLEPADYQADALLQSRHGCSKPIRLVESKAKGGKQNLTLARDLVEQAESLAAGSDGQPPCCRIAIVVNRVECAREALRLLQKKPGTQCELMIGRMRPLDRDQLTKKLQDSFQSGTEATLTAPHFVVATQCLEVGADFDFDGMVSQCANLDALRQRFGRLNRLGNSSYARGVIVMAEGDQAPRKPDPIYEESLPRTWKWLNQHSSDQQIDFGVHALDALIAERRTADAAEIERLSVPALNAPVLMPAHLDLLCQTSPRPALEPEIAPYLHGPGRGVAEVRVCWRADLPVYDGKKSKWESECRKTLAACPPSTAECLSVPLPVLKAWLKGEEKEAVEDSSDLLGAESDDSDDDEGSERATTNRSVAHRRGVTWNGRECHAVSGAARELKAVYPQSLVVLPATAGGWSTLGHVPNAPDEPSTEVQSDSNSEQSTKRTWQLARIDVASEAFEQARNRLILRVHPSLLTSAADEAALDSLLKYVKDETLEWNRDKLKVTDEAEDLHGDAPESESASPLDFGRSRQLLETRQRLAEFPARQTPMVRYPGGFVVTGPKKKKREALPRASFDDDFDEHNVDARKRVSLSDHLADVTGETQRLVDSINLDERIAAAVVAAAERHDLGKADLRFQAMLLGSTPDVAAMQPQLWAKSARGFVPTNSHSLPSGFRHEMLSVALARKVQDDLDTDGRDLMLHLIAAHHGCGRPFAPVVVDDAPLNVSLRELLTTTGQQESIELTSDEQRQSPAHRLDSGISERYWTLNQRFGWWGLAWLETALRLADWVASAQPIQPSIKSQPLLLLNNSPPPSPLVKHRLNFVGLNGGNPLGFLAALGLFRHFTATLDPTIRLQWELNGGSWSPTLTGSHPILASQSELIEWLFTSLQPDSSPHWLKRLNELSDELLGLERPSEYSRIAEMVTSRDRLAADWMSCNGSDLCEAASNNQLQTARRDYFPESAAAIINALTRDHLERTLFRLWDYADPIQKVSLHLEPREDRRHAYQWHKPVGDPTRALRGGMVGANRLAMEAWPFFQSVAVRRELQTIGFQGTRPTKGIYWTWPIWTTALSTSDLVPLLNFQELLPDLESERIDFRQALQQRGIAAAFRLRRILVEKTPNFTPAVAIMAQ